MVILCHNMTNTETGRDERPHDRTDETELPRDEHAEADETNSEDEDPDAIRECHRRGCDRPATFVVLERYQEETGQGAVEAEALLCLDHTAEESPANLDGVYADYVFRVEPIPETAGAA